MVYNNGFDNSQLRAKDGKWTDGSKTPLEKAEENIDNNALQIIEVPSTVGKKYSLRDNGSSVGELEVKNRSDGYVEIMNAKIGKEHRGKGLYGRFLVSLSSKTGKSIISLNQDRNSDSSRVWEKLKSAKGVQVSTLVINGKEYLMLNKK